MVLLVDLDECESDVLNLCDTSTTNCVNKDPGFRCPCIDPYDVFTDESETKCVGQYQKFPPVHTTSFPKRIECERRKLGGAMFTSL